MSDFKPPVVSNPWASLRRFTAARIALGRTGVSQPTGAQLAFQLDHARARDAVHRPFDAAGLAGRLATVLSTPAASTGPPGPTETTVAPLPWLALASAAASRAIYLQRPDLGRRLDEASRQTLGGHEKPPRPWDLALVIGDGLSALAVERQAPPFLQALLPRLDRAGWSLAPLIVVSQARVAIGDEIGELLGARAVVVLIGERPGLSSPDSMGLYMTWAPRLGLTDDSRNCISNVRPEGLSHELAARQLAQLLGQARQRQLSGVRLKVEALLP